MIKIGQVYRGPYKVNYEVVGIYGEYIWTKSWYTLVSAKGQPPEPVNRNSSFFDGMELIQ